MTAPDFSVVIPCYNYGRFLRQAVESAIRQPGVTLEVVVVDDCSTDDSAGVIAELAAEYGLRTHTNESNLGLVGTLNVGLGLATGAYVICLSADDFLAPSALSRQARAFREHPHVGMVFGSYLRYKEGDSVPPAEVYTAATLNDGRRVHVHDGQRWLARRCRVGNNPIGAAAVAVRRTVAEQVGPYDPRCRHTSDLNMWLRVAAVSDVAFVSNGPVAYYRKHAVSMSSVQFGASSVDLNERWIAYESALRTVPDERVAAKLLDQVRRTLAEEALLRARAYQELGNADEYDELIRVVDELDVEQNHSVPDFGSTLGDLRVLRGRRRFRLWWRRRLLSRKGW